ncbi:MAG: hypothetical protein ABR568_09630 [Pyrinomonadaceae bacterium]
MKIRAVSLIRLVKDANGTWIDDRNYNSKSQLLENDTVLIAVRP